MAQYNIKNIREEFKSKGIFYTQPELAEYMKSLVDVDITVDNKKCMGFKSSNLSAYIELN